MVICRIIDQHKEPIIKGIVAFVGVVAVFLFGTVITAKAADGVPKIGVVNTQRILSESKEGKEVRLEFEKLLNEKKAMLEDKGKVAKDIEAELQKDGDKMKPADRQAKRDKLASEIVVLRRLTQDTEDQLRKEGVDRTTKVLRDAYTIARKIGQDQKYTVIFQTRQQIIYADPSVDLTEEVLKALDAQYKGQ
jgi:outer membrane protein